MNPFSLLTVFFQISGFIFHVSASAASLHTVLILQHRFEPETVRVQPGDTVRWVHQDAAAHTVTGTGTEVWDSEYMAFGDIYTRVFANPGSFDYVCLYHPMYGKVVVEGPSALTPPGRSSAPTSGRKFGERNASETDTRDALGRKTEFRDFIFSRP